MLDAPSMVKWIFFFFFSNHQKQIHVYGAEMHNEGKKQIIRRSEIRDGHRGKNSN
jgi:hypothetical protein